LKEVRGVKNATKYEILEFLGIERTKRGDKNETFGIFEIE
jgi:hypothetical protein